MVFRDNMVLEFSCAGKSEITYFKSWHNDTSTKTSAIPWFKSHDIAGARYTVNTVETVDYVLSETEILDAVDDHPVFNKERTIPGHASKYELMGINHVRIVKSGDKDPLAGVAQQTIKGVFPTLHHDIKWYWSKRIGSSQSMTGGFLTAPAGSE